MSQSSSHNDDRSRDRDNSVLRSLPSSHDAERAVLSCCIKVPDVAIPTVHQSIGSGDDIFHKPSHYVIWAALVGCWHSKGKVDLVTLNQAISDAGESENVGGAAELAALADEVPTVALLDQYLGIVRDKAIRRNLFIQLNRTSAKVYDTTVETADLLDEAEAAMFQLREFASAKKKAGLRAAVEIIPKVIDELEHAYRNRGKTTRGIPTGFGSWDRFTMGLAPASVTIIAARPSMGKTAFAMNVAEYVALDSGHNTAVFSLEMSAEELLKRTICGRADTKMYKTRDGFFSEMGFEKVLASAKQIKDAGSLFIDDTGGLSIQDLRSRARQAKARHDIKLIVIDYVQLLKSVTKQAQANRYVEIGEISRGIKEMAKELDLPVIMLAQLSRKVEERREKIPMLSDLRESGDLEQDADMVALLHRPGYYSAREAKGKDHDPDFEQPDDNSAKLFIAKQRNGPVGEVDFIFDKESVKFIDPKGDKLYD